MSTFSSVLMFPRTEKTEILITEVRTPGLGDACHTVTQKSRIHMKRTCYHFSFFKKNIFIDYAITVVPYFFQRNLRNP